MAKKSNSKKKKADSAKSRNVSDKPRALNPFEVHVNRQKFKVLGRKDKNDRGLPGVSRAKALKKRKATLLQEYRVHNKANEFVDRRIGENNKGMTAEDRIVARFTAERNKNRKKSRFNLADDEVLTHRGQSLNEIEKFDDPRSDSEDEDERESGKLEAKFVGDAHFGGFLSRKEETESSNQNRQSLIQELIADSKKRKAEKQRENEKTAELTAKLDTDWKDLQAVVYNSKTKKQKNDPAEENEPKPKIDDYDKAVRQLTFESRGVPSDRLKSEDEVAKEEKERLELLEAERLARMHGKYDGLKPVPKHRSADDLDDGFEYEEDDQMLSYNEEGNVNNGVLRSTILAEESGSEDEEVEEECEDKDNEDRQEESEEDDDADSLSDLRLKVSDNDEESDEDEDKNIKENKKSQVSAAPDLAKLKEMMDKARKELPYTFAVPETYTDFIELFEDKALAQQSVILERMVKCNHPSLGANNTAKLGAMYAFLLQWINDNTIEPPANAFVSNPNEDFLNTLLPHIFEIVQLSGPGNARRCTAAVLTEKHEEWRKKGAKKIPPLDTVIFFQLILHIFPTSDFRHPVTSPAAVFMAEILNNAVVQSLRDVSNGLFICELVAQYTTLSQRFLPEAYQFLTDIICALIEKESNARFGEKLDPSDLGDEVLSASVRILHKMAEQSRSNVPSLPVILKPAVEALSRVRQQRLKALGAATAEAIEGLKKICLNPGKLEVMMMEKKRPKPLKLYEPRVEAKIYDGKRRVNMSEKKRERVKLVHKYKREMKGAVREIRRDRDFLAKVQLKETMKNDAVRKAKVKDILGSLATQAGELNKIDRSKKKKK
ncbi:nucleolar protein 14 [Neocloeon triangulifer]|uniref:nucleolar protein 14 n=1 Tax=Neocloeon triangulifer TaxID=2078957 RepID=UPI00286F74B1|nr:nucleolar protein 14 [Neocloeon triangulifer]